MSEGSVVVVMMMSGMMLSCAIAGGLFILTSTNKPTTAPTPTTSATTTTKSLTTFTKDQKVSLRARDGTYAGYTFDASNTTNMCNIAFGQSGPKEFMLTKGTSGTYAIKANCDGDGKFTSYLTEKASDIIQPKRTGSADRWTLACTTQGCSIQGVKTKKYLAPAGLASSAYLWTVT